MSLFDSLGAGNQQQGQVPNAAAQQAITQLKADPAGVLKQIGFNVPAGMNNAQQIVQHLMQTGQVPPTRFAQAMQMIGQMTGRR